MMFFHLLFLGLNVFRPIQELFRMNFFNSFSTVFDTFILVIVTLYPKSQMRIELQKTSN
jgi:hypothetical protein